MNDAQAKETLYAVAAANARAEAREKQSVDPYKKALKEIRRGFPSIIEEASVYASPDRDLIDGIIGGIVDCACELLPLSEFKRLGAVDDISEAAAQEAVEQERESTPEDRAQYHMNERGER